VVDTHKTRTFGLPCGEETMIMLSLSIEYRDVTDGRMDRFAISISRVSVLTGDKKDKTSHKSVLFHLFTGKP